jgi:hypothetical protein
MRELAIQGANDTLGADQRSAIDKEIKQLVALVMAGRSMWSPTYLKTYYNKNGQRHGGIKKGASG